MDRPIRIRRKIPFLIFLMATACQQEITDREIGMNYNSQDVIITASLGVSDTRTQRDGEGVVYWSPSDEIGIISAGEYEQFISQNTEPSKIAKFKGRISVITGASDGSAYDYIWGMYPYQSNRTYAEIYEEPQGVSETAVLTLEVPTEQIGIPGTFGEECAPAFGRSETLTISFRNTYSGLCFTVNSADIVSLKLTSNNGEAVAGRFKAGLDASGTPELKGIVEGSSSVTLRAPDGETFVPGQNYYMTMIPDVTLSGGYTLTAYTQTEKGSIASSSSATFRRNVFRQNGMAKIDQTISNYGTGFQSRPDPDNISIPTFSSAGWLGEVGDEVTLKVRVSGPEDFGFDTGKIYNTIDLDVFEKTETGWTRKGIFWENTYVLKAIGTTSSTTFIFFYGDPLTVDYTDLEGTTVCYAELPVSILEHGEEIEFADPVTEAICLANYDRNSDGVLTINEAANVATLLVNGESPFKRPDSDNSLPQITSFDELRYFTGLTEIPDYAFYRQFSLASIILPEDITSIGIRAFFMNPVLSTIEIPDGVETIGDFAFGVCNSLQEVTIPASVYVIGNRAFYSCGNLSSVTFEEGNLNTIGDGAFSWSQLAWIEIPDSVTSFGTSVFEHSTVGHVRLPSSLKILPESTFYCAKVYEIVHSGWNQITEIGDYAFGAYSTSYGVTVPRALPTGLKTIGNRAFQYATLPAEFTLPKSLIKIGDYAFRYCSTLTKVELPATLATIGYGAFSQCPLEEIKVRRTTPASITQLESGTLGETFGTLPDLNGVILVPYDREASYKSSWATWADYIQNDLNTIPGGGNIGDDGDFGDGGDA